MEVISKTSEYLQPNPGKAMDQKGILSVLIRHSIKMYRNCVIGVGKCLLYYITDIYGSLNTSPITATSPSLPLTVSLSPSLSASRAKLSMLNTVSKIRGQVKNPGYPQAEGLLGECMVKYGRDLGEETNFGTLCLSACLPVCLSVSVCLPVHRWYLFCGVVN